MFACDVRVTARVVADQHGAQTRNNTSSTQYIDSGPKLVLDLSRYRFAIENRCRHIGKYPGRLPTLANGSVVGNRHVLAANPLFGRRSKCNRTTSDRDSKNEQQIHGLIRVAHNDIEDEVRHPSAQRSTAAQRAIRPSCARPRQQPQ